MARPPPSPIFRIITHFDLINLDLSRSAYDPRGFASCEVDPAGAPGHPV